MKFIGIMILVLTALFGGLFVCIWITEGIKKALSVFGKVLIFHIVLFLLAITLIIVGCYYQSPKECCSDRGGVQMCYHPNSRTQGYIMCKDGYICSDVRCE